MIVGPIAYTCDWRSSNHPNDFGHYGPGRSMESCLLRHSGMRFHDDNESSPAMQSRATGAID